ncbi:MAG TPA: DUF4382 domain-containing protein [Gemmatimonadales bacterium]
MANRTLTGRAWASLAVLGAAVGAACQGQPGDPDATAAVSVTMQRVGAGTAAQAAAGWFASATGGMGRIDLATVDSLMVTLDRIEFLPAVQDEGDENGENGDGEGGGWVSLDVEDVRFDLLALPTTDETGIVLVTGELPVGDYLRVRLFVTDPMVWFNTPIQLGQAFTFDPDVGYDVFIPSGDQTGIKTDQGFSIPEGGGDVTLVFDENASLANVAATGNGRVILAPVIRVNNP